MKCLGRRGLIGGVEEHEEGGVVSFRAGVSPDGLHEPGMSLSLQTIKQSSQISNMTTSVIRPS